jgi:thiosulfate/3-mercaptopyruvate sulfurtransferase
VRREPKEVNVTKTKCVLLLLVWQLLGIPFAWAGAVKVSPPRLLIETATLARIRSQVSVRILDVRSPAEYRQGHLPGAVDLPARATEDLEANRQGFPMRPEEARRLFRTAGVSATSRVVLYDDQGSLFAARVFYVLKFFGQRRVQVLNGGFRKWQSEGRPVATNAPTVAPGRFVPRPNSALIATSEWLAAHLKEVKLVDARSPGEYMLGHIPGAVNIDSIRTLEPGEIKTLRPAEQLEALFAAAHVTREQEVVTYCQVAVRAAELYFVLQLLGYPRVRVYDGSWEDWYANPALPVER